jgi:hypothetical protein
MVNSGLWRTYIRLVRERRGESAVPRAASSCAVGASASVRTARELESFSGQTELAPRRERQGDKDGRCHCESVQKMAMDACERRMSVQHAGSMMCAWCWCRT